MLGVGVSVSYTLMTLYAAITNDGPWVDAARWFAYLLLAMSIMSWWVDDDEAVALKGGGLVQVIRIVMLCWQVMLLVYAGMIGTAIIRAITEAVAYLRLRSAETMLDRGES